MCCLASSCLFSNSCYFPYWSNGNWSTWARDTHAHAHARPSKGQVIDFLQRNRFEVNSPRGFSWMSFTGLVKYILIYVFCFSYMLLCLMNWLVLSSVLVSDMLSCAHFLFGTNSWTLIMWDQTSCWIQFHFCLWITIFRLFYFFEPL